MSVNPNQTNTNATTSFFALAGSGGGGGGGGSNDPNPSFSTITVASGGVFGDKVLTNGPLQWSIYNKGAATAILTGVMDNKATQNPTITQDDGATLTLLQASAFCAGAGAGAIPFYSGNGGEPYIYTSYNNSNVDILKTKANQVELGNVSSVISADQTYTLNWNAFISTMAAVYPDIVSPAK